LRTQYFKVTNTNGAKILNDNILNYLDSDFTGRNLQYDRKDVLEITDPHKVGLPMPNMSSKFIFAKEDLFFLYPNNYSHFNRMYKDTFQHGGISLEEVICPLIRLSSK